MVTTSPSEKAAFSGGKNIFQWLAAGPPGSGRAQAAHSWENVPPGSGWQEQGLPEKSARWDAGPRATAGSNSLFKGKEAEGEKKANGLPPFLQHHQKSY